MRNPAYRIVEAVQEVPGVPKTKTRLLKTRNRMAKALNPSDAKFARAFSMLFMLYANLW
jgi:hypothetical protein